VATLGAVNATRLSVVGLVVLGCALAATASGAGRANGIGRMTVAPTVLYAGSNGNELTFTFKADSSSLRGQTLVLFPRGWSPPQRRNAAAPGYVEVTADGYVFLSSTRSLAAGKKTKFRPLLPGKQPVVKVRGGSPARLIVQTTSVATTGTAFSVTVRALDGWGNNAYPYLATVQLSSSDLNATVPGPYAYVPTDVAQHTFTGIVLRTPGIQTIAATDSSGMTASSPPIQVVPPSG
jgi:hypothetical protein